MPGASHHYRTHGRAHTASEAFALLEQAIERRDRARAEVRRCQKLFHSAGGIRALEREQRSKAA